METILKKRRREIALKRYNEACRRLKPAIDFLYKNGAREVYLFGSITDPQKFTEHSDIDIAVKGIPVERQLDLEGRLEDILSGFEYDIIFLDVDGVREEIRERMASLAILSLISSLTPSTSKNIMSYSNPDRISSSLPSKSSCLSTGIPFTAMSISECSVNFCGSVMEPKRYTSLAPFLYKKSIAGFNLRQASLYRLRAISRLLFLRIVSMLFSPYYLLWAMLS